MEIGKIILKDSSGKLKELNDEMLDQMIRGLSDKRTALLALKTGNIIEYVEIVIRFFMKENITKRKKILYDKMFNFAPVSISFSLDEKEIIVSYEPDEYSDTLLLIKEVILKNQYSANEGNIKGKVILDCGTHIGMFSLLAAHLGAKKVYSFEPMPKTYQLLKRNIDQNGFSDIIIPINKGVGVMDGKATLHYNSEADTGAGFVLTPEDPNSIKVDVVRIDTMFEGREKLGFLPEKVGFIKMDVEGWEEEALKGATKTIQKYKPVLSFSAYHKPTDKQRLPAVVNSIRNDYNIVLNTYGEDDFYCD